MRLNNGEKKYGLIKKVVGIEGGIKIEYDSKKKIILWVEGKEDEEENWKIYVSKYGGGKKKELMGIGEYGIVGEK